LNFLKNGNGEYVLATGCIRTCEEIKRQQGKLEELSAEFEEKEREYLCEGRCLE